MDAGRPLSILALVGDAYGGWGGIAQYNRDLFEGLMQSGYVRGITVLPRNAASVAGTPAGIEQLPPASSKPSYVAQAFRLALVRRHDIVFCGHINLIRLSAQVARIANARLVLQLHGIEAWQPPSRGVRKACGRADYILSVSRYTRGRLLQWSKLPPHRALVVPNTVSPAYIAASGGALREKLGLAGRKVLLTVGRLDAREAYKGHDRVIAMMSRLAAADIDCVYVIVGTGNDRARLEAEAARHDVTDRVIFTGAVSYDDLPDYYRMADLFMMPSTGEGFGIAYLEAMACGTPALGFRAGGTPDPMQDGELGLLCDVDDEALFEATVQALTSPSQERDELSRRLITAFGKQAFNGHCRELAHRLAGAD